MKKRGLIGIAAMLVVGLIVAVGLSGCGTAKAAVQEETAQSHFERGREFDDKKDRAKAIEEYSKAIELDPNFANAYASHGMKHYQLGSKTSAMADFNKAIELDPKNFMAYTYRGAVNADIVMNSPLGPYFSDRETTAACKEVIELCDLALADFDKTKEFLVNFSNAQPDAVNEFMAMNDSINPVIDKVQKKKAEAEAKIADILAREEANRYDPANFIVVPASNFKPADYTKADLFDAVAAAEKLKVSDQNWISGAYYTPSKEFASEVVFVRQDGTSITFRTDDNAISQTMKVNSRTGLTVGQKVRIYYSAYRIEAWQIVAIERL